MSEGLIPRRCLVTGATGHVGAALTHRLLADGCEVAVLVRPESDLWRIGDVQDQVTLIRGALGDLDSAREPLRAWQPDTAFHLAWGGVTGAFRNDTAQITQNVSGSLELLDAVREAGCRCWVGVGSQAEYGAVDGLLREDLPTRPETAYGVAKRALGMLTEKLCAMTGMRWVWVRLLATYGPKDDPRHLLPAVITQLLDGQAPQLTPGAQRWDYLYIDDAAEALARLALDTDAAGVFNLGSGEAHTVRSLTETVRDLIDPALPLNFGAVPYRPDQVMHLQASIEALVSATGWRPRTGLAEGLARTVAWHREQPQERQKPQ